MERHPQYQMIPRKPVPGTDDLQEVNINESLLIGKSMTGRYADIITNFVIVTVPMLLFTAVLLGLVFHYRVSHNSPPFKDLPIAGAQDEAGVYYVNIEATVLIFISSWSSSLAPILTGFVLALTTYPIARKFLREARAHQPQQLLTPYQLALTLKFLDGSGAGALWNWLKYSFGWKSERHRQASPLKNTASMTVLATILAHVFIVFAADTWLHITTKTVIFIQVTPVLQGADYSLSLLPSCTIGNNSFVDQEFKAHPCSLNPGGSVIFLLNGIQSLQVLNNVSDITTVLAYEGDSTYTYLGIPPSDTLSQRDYVATTFGISTQCKPISNECNLNAYDGASTPFECTPAFSGDVTQAPGNIVTTYLTNAAMSSNFTESGIQNPFYVGIAALVNQQVQDSLAETTSTPIPEIVTPVHGGISFVLLCTATVYDIQYYSINGTVTRLVATTSNDSTTNIWQGANAYPGYGSPQLQQAASLAALSSSAQELADKIAVAYSKIALAIGAEAVMPTPALAAQERSSSLVARVPAAPLFTLVVANLLFVTLGVVLTLVALSTSGGEVRDVQARLSIVGLVADRFEGMKARRRVESIDELFEERDGQRSTQVAIDRVAGGGYAYKAWPVMKQ